MLARLVGMAYFAVLPELMPALALVRPGVLDWVHSPTFRSLAGLPATS